MANGKEVLDRDSIKDTFDLATKAAEKFQFKVAQGHLQVLLNQFPGIKTALRNYNNTLTSISEGLKDGALTRAGALIEVRSAGVELESAMSKAMDTLSQPAKYDPEVLYKDLSKDSLKVYDKNMNEVQTKLNRSGVFVGYVPILPLTTPALDHSKLKAAGIPADHFAGYTILKKEFVAGIHRDEINKLLSEEITPSTSASKRKELEDEVIKHFQESVQAKYKHLKLVQMGELASWWESIWFWYAPASEFKLLKSCTIASATVQSLKIKNWSFPFNR